MLLYLCTIISGFSSLVYQVVWQRYLAILVGSEARSLSLVVAIFLFGLASGYYAFGRITGKDWKRKKLLKAYGYAELFIASYAILFPTIFPLLKSWSFTGPSTFFFDIFITMLAIFLPTFLMGASIPMLTMVVPNKAEEVNHCHAKVYGWNTFGAFLGTIGAGFLFIPKIGLPFTLYLAGLLNVSIAFVFLTNSLKGPTHKSQDIPQANTLTPNWFYLLFVLIVGATTICLEMNMVRLLNLSISSGVYNFPIILSIFILALALGSLSIKASNITAKSLITRLSISIILLMFLSYTVPYWSIWINHIRISLTSIESNYFIFLACIYIFAFVFLFFPVFFLGQLLPLAYGLIKKTKKNYGALCGKIYFCNTVGNMLGATVLGYLALYIFNLDEIFKINLILLALLLLALSVFEEFFRSTILASALLLICIFFPAWDRSGHHVGYSQITVLNKQVHFQGLFEFPNIHKGKVSYFDDGPNTTVTLISYERKLNQEGSRLVHLGFPSIEYSIIVNGKFDSNSHNDFTTLFLLPTLPYLYLSPIKVTGKDTVTAKRKKSLLTAVIGMGTGISAGVLGKLDRIGEVVVLEISPKVIEAVKKIDEFNFGASSNPKIKIVEKDAFKYFTRNKRKFDLIVSEPSNPWVIGVENLFTLDFYKMAKKSLSENGILSQWMSLRSMNNNSFQLVVESLDKAFPYIQLHLVGKKDVVILASLKPFKKDILNKNFRSNAFLSTFLNEMGLKAVHDVHFTKLLSEPNFKLIGRSSLSKSHSLEFPQLSYHAFKDFFLGTIVSLDSILPRVIHRQFSIDSDIIAAFEKYKDMDWKEIKEYCSTLLSFFCNKVSVGIEHWKNMQDSDAKASDRIDSYAYLRNRSYIRSDSRFLRKLIRNKVLSSLEELRQDERRKLISKYIMELIVESQFAEARLQVLEFKRYMGKEDVEAHMAFIAISEKLLEDWHKKDWHKKDWLKKF